MIRTRGQITLPRDIRDALHVDEGDDISFVITDEGVLMHGLKMVPAEQAWFWSAQGIGRAERGAQTGVRGLLEGQPKLPIDLLQ